MVEQGLLPARRDGVATRHPDHRSVHGRAPEAPVLQVAPGAVRWNPARDASHRVQTAAETASVDPEADERGAAIDGRGVVGSAAVSGDEQSHVQHAVAADGVRAGVLEQTREEEEMALV